MHWLVFCYIAYASFSCFVSSTRDMQSRGWHGSVSGRQTICYICDCRSIALVLSSKSAIIVTPVRQAVICLSQTAIAEITENLYMTTASPVLFQGLGPGKVCRATLLWLFLLTSRMRNKCFHSSDSVYSPACEYVVPRQLGYIYICRQVKYKFWVTDLSPRQTARIHLKRFNSGDSGPHGKWLYWRFNLYFS
jgi:hypothetical protein